MGRNGERIQAVPRGSLGCRGGGQASGEARPPPGHWPTRAAGGNASNRSSAWPAPASAGCWSPPSTYSYLTSYPKGQSFFPTLFIPNLEELIDVEAVVLRAGHLLLQQRV